MPPPKLAELPIRLVLLIVSAALPDLRHCQKMPPPESAELLVHDAIVHRQRRMVVEDTTAPARRRLSKSIANGQSFDRHNVAGVMMRNMRKGAAVRYLVMTIRFDPGPLIVMFLSITSSPLVRRIIASIERGSRPGSMSPLLAAAIVLRSEPVPLSSQARNGGRGRAEHFRPGHRRGPRQSIVAAPKTRGVGGTVHMMPALDFFSSSASICVICG